MNDVLRLRKEAGLTQAALAQASGVAQPNIAAYESGRRKPNEPTMARLRRAVLPRPSTLVERHREEIHRLVAKHRAEHPRIFGSVAKGIDRPDSDLDLIVRFEKGASLYDLVELRDELQDLLGIRVDVLSERGISARHAHLLAAAVPL